MTLAGRRKTGSDPSDQSGTPGVAAENLDDTTRLPLVVGPEVIASSGPTPATEGNVLTRPADPTQVIPRIRPNVQTPWIADPDRTTTFARVDATTAPSATPDEDVADPPRDPITGPAATDTDTDTHTDTDTGRGIDTESANEGPGRGDGAEIVDAGRRRHGWVWAGLTVFWLLALGAGLVTLASLGAPHYLCTGTASTGLACKRTGTVIAAVLTVVLIIAVGSVSVLAIEKRMHASTAWRWLGFGVVALVVVASCGYLLIRTIGG